ncbi:MAG: 3-phosphoserine/phosphohydroxythreonine transaminase [Clostridia bacterium]|nr:3-phosphoserine/phosphohydroxythreonine transaminase [Clostridia bacterium]
MERVYNFAAGPAVMPEEALRRAADEMLNYRGSDMSVMEMSHRSAAYQDIFDRTAELLRQLLDIPQDYAVLLLQGGATGQFAAVPMNLLSASADYIDSGHFAHSAMAEAQKYGSVRCAASTREQGYCRVPAQSELRLDPAADYLYYCANNTIYGTAFSYIPETDAPIVADMSSNILSAPVDVRRFGVIFAGAQKNIGPAGLTVVIARRSLLGRAREITPAVFNWQVMDEKGSMLNTPPTYAIYMAGLCLEWLLDQGGVAAIHARNRRKADLLYAYLDQSRLFRGKADRDSRSLMNVTFTTDDPALDSAFAREASEKGLCSLKGHRVAGGMRASIYNAMPEEGVRRLIDFMADFEKKALKQR